MPWCCGGGGGGAAAICFRSRRNSQDQDGEGTSTGDNQRIHHLSLACSDPSQSVWRLGDVSLRNTTVCVLAFLHPCLRPRGAATRVCMSSRWQHGTALGAVLCTRLGVGVAAIGVHAHHVAMANERNRGNQVLQDPWSRSLPCVHRLRGWPDVNMRSDMATAAIAFAALTAVFSGQAVPAVAGAIGVAASRDCRRSCLHRWISWCVYRRTYGQHASPDEAWMKPSRPTRCSLSDDARALTLEFVLAAVARDTLGACAAAELARLAVPAVARAGWVVAF
jgi:hypothetical protein